MDIMSYLMGQNSAIKKGMKVEVVTELPETGQENTVYLVPKQSGSESDLFDEYLYINNAWEHIGSANIDLSNYYTKSEVNYKTTPYLYLPIRGDQSSEIVRDEDTCKTASEIINYFYNNQSVPARIWITTRLEQPELMVYDRSSSGTIDIQDTSYTFRMGPKYHSTDAFYINTTCSIEGTWTNNIFTCTKIYHMTGSTLYLSNYATKTDVNNITGTLSNLDTTDKTSLVNAINEVASSGGGNNVHYYELDLGGEYLSHSTLIFQDAYKQQMNDIINDMYQNNNNNPIICIRTTRISQPVILNVSYNKDISQKPTTLQFSGIANDMNGTIAEYHLCSIFRYGMTIPVTWNDNVASVGAFTINYCNSKMLTTANTTAYTPTYQYHPATKKYVDDSIASAITDALGGSY